MTILGKINLIEISILALLLGIVTSLDVPTRQAFTAEMVDKKDLGSGGAFILNAISYLTVIAVLLFIKTNVIISRTHKHPLSAIKDGLVYSFTHPVIKTLLIFTAVTSIFGWSYITIMPVVVQQVFHKDAFYLGYFYSSAGIGALLGSIFISIIYNKVNPKTIIVAGNALFIISIFLFTFTTNIILALIFLFLGSLQIGYFAQNLGLQFAIRLGAVILFFFGFLVVLIRSRQEVKKRLFLLN